MKQLRDYQIELSENGSKILNELGIVYYSMEVRTGKTLTALNTVKLCSFKKCLFLTKKKAIKSIENDYKDFGYNEYYELTVINNESLHLIIENDFDIIIMDEAHRCGSFPKPAKIAEDLKERFSNLPIILLSGTPHPENFSQIYHQFWISKRSPFVKYKNFYNWFNGMGFVKVDFDLGFGVVANYTNKSDVIYKYYSILLRSVSKDNPDYEILKLEVDKQRGIAIERMELSNILLQYMIRPYMVTYTQKEAGFTTKVIEHILHCDMNPMTYKIINKLKKDRVIEGKEEVILADTAVKLMGKIHQLCSGTIKFESGNSSIIDTSKADFIKEKFSGSKIAIFYKFKEELNMLQQVFKDQLTTELDIFNTTEQNIALQIVSGREGISLSKAQYLIYLNIDFSAVSYWQSRDRLTTMDRLTNDIYWVFSIGGIEEKIYNTVMGKKNYTLSVFEKEYLK